MDGSIVGYCQSNVTPKEQPSSVPKLVSVCLRQPRSQGPLLPVPWSEKETLVTCLPAKKNSPDGVPVLEGSSPQILVNIIWFLRSAMFYSSLHFAIVNSSYWNINLKPKQVQSLEATYFRSDTIGVLPTGDRKERTLGTRLCLR